MRMILEALSAETEALDILFFTSHDIKTDGLARFQSELNCKWGLRANLMLCTKRKVISTSTHSLASLIDARNDKTYARTSADRCVEAIERCLKNKPDLIFVHRLQAMCPLLSVRRALPPVIFDLDDIEHVKKLRGIRHPDIKRENWLYKLLQLPALIRLEWQAVRLARRTFVCSERDRFYLTQLLRLSGVEVVKNAVDIPDMPISAEPRMVMGFLGTFGYQPNVNAAEELAASVWPIVRARLPQANLVIAGHLPERIPSFAQLCSSDGGITFAGFIKNLRQFYNQLQLVCCPIRSGGGTRIKIIEAAAHGLPVVATRIAAEGLDFADGVEIVLTESPGAIAQACIELLSDPVRCREIGMAARAKATAVYQRLDAVASIRGHLQALK